MKTILVVGASGFIGRRLVKSLLSKGLTVRCLARDTSNVVDLAGLGAQVMKGDVSEPSSLSAAFNSIDAVYVLLHTLSPQPASRPEQRFMAVELEGLRNIVEACRLNGVGRIIYVTSLGVSASAASEWLRERWRAEQSLFQSGLDATVLRPGMIVGVGGRGFGALSSQGAKSVAIFLGSKQKMRTIAVDDLIGYLVGILDEPRSFGKAFDVGNDDVLTNSQMVDGVAEVLGRRHPYKILIPPAFLSMMAPLIERMGKLPRGGLKGLVDSLGDDASGDPKPIRAIQPQRLLSYRQAVERALETTK